MLGRGRKVVLTQNHRMNFFENTSELGVGFRYDGHSFRIMGAWLAWRFSKACTYDAKQLTSSKVLCAGLTLFGGRAKICKKSYGIKP